MATLRLGSKGEDVRRLKHLLNTALKPSPNLSNADNFGTKTEAAVRRFQKSKGLDDDGVVGPKTWTQLGQKISTAPEPKSNAPKKKTWMDVAKAELGVMQNGLPGKDNERIVEYHSTTTLQATDDETYWCSSFVNWVMIQSGHPGTNSARAKSWLLWGDGGILDKPKYGAITVVKKIKKATTKKTDAKKTAATAQTASGYHVAFYVSSSETHIRLLGGNQSKRVKYSDFDLEKWELVAYLWPK